MEMLKMRPSCSGELGTALTAAAFAQTSFLMQTVSGFGLEGSPGGRALKTYPETGPLLQ